MDITFKYRKNPSPWLMIEYNEKKIRLTINTKTDITYKESKAYTKFGFLLRDTIATKEDMVNLVFEKSENPKLHGEFQLKSGSMLQDSDELKALNEQFFMFKLPKGDIQVKPNSSAL